MRPRVVALLAAVLLVAGCDPVMGQPPPPNEPPAEEVITLAIKAFGPGGDDILTQQVSRRTCSCSPRNPTWRAS